MYSHYFESTSPPRATTVKAVVEAQLHARTHTCTKQTQLEVTLHSLLKRTPIDFPLLNTKLLVHCWVLRDKLAWVV